MMDFLDSPAVADKIGMVIVSLVFALIAARLAVPRAVQHKIRRIIHHPSSLFRQA